MKRTTKRILTLAFFCVLAWASAAVAGEKKALLIMLDGLRADALYSAETPNIDSLRDGTWAKGYHGTWTYQAHTNLDAPPSSATNHTAIATGVTATKNNVFQNGQFKQGHYDQYPTWLQRLRKSKPHIVSAWLHNWGDDTDLPTDADYVMAKPNGFDGDMELVEQAKQILAGTFPDTEGLRGTKWSHDKDIDALMLYLDSLDMFGHGHGFSVQVDAYYEKVPTYDQKVGELIQAIKSRPNFAKEDWMIVVVADHGGTGKTHGIVGCKNCYTIPLIVTSKHVKSGQMAGQPINCAVAAYLMKHFTGSVPKDFDGKIAPIHKTPPAKLDAGKLGEGDLAKLKKKPAKDFSFVIWFRANKDQNGDPALVSNKDWKNGQNPGFCLAANVSDKNGCNAWLNFGDGKGRDDFKPLEYKPNEWTFFGVSVEKKGNAVLFVGGQNGRLSFISDSVANLGSFATDYDWHIGQDGTGNYQHSLDGETKGFTFWPAALSIDQMNQLYKEGLGK